MPPCKSLRPEVLTEGKGIKNGEQKREMVSLVASRPVMVGGVVVCPANLSLCFPQEKRPTRILEELLPELKEEVEPCGTRFGLQ